MSILILLIDTVGGLFVMAILLRFLLQLVKADFYNPISQAIVKITSPLLNPLRRIIPGVGGYDIASLVLAFIVQAIFVLLKLKALGYMAFPPGTVISLSLYFLVKALLDLYTFALIIMVIASWVAPNSYNPGLMLLHQLTEPLCSRVRRVVPPIGGLDFSVMVVMLAIVIIKGALPSLIPGM
ncbi:YggT family protein [Sansalvadorimonas sp. 2012CJ34-2]|uniref:YggT family protein n=1 Tax=Parendozoicomonas callyspongiae TaxID=2942213 RepID=A0ABT0PAN8_9GAMM|nr:YggT family protein [Sansalvadorimonas sp. 2012CJ34-2]MCL6268459.1 YggT family protein [Sansalvadorimonas sp. 2012CJ34-2]